MPRLNPHAAFPQKPSVSAYLPGRQYDAWTLEERVARGQRGEGGGVGGQNVILEGGGGSAYMPSKVSCCRMIYSALHSTRRL